MKKNRLLSVILGAVLLLTGCSQNGGNDLDKNNDSDNISSTELSQTENPASDFKYETHDNEITITGYVGTSQKVIIPEKIDGKPVAVINRTTFFENENIAEIVLPDSVKKIETSAFCRCHNLRFVTLSNNLTEIPDFAFCETYLFSIKIPSGITSIGYGAFQNCPQLNSMQLPEGVKSISSYAYAYCPAFGDLLLPESLIEIGNDVFTGSDCVSLHYKGEIYSLDNRNDFFKALEATSNTPISSDSSSSTDTEISTPNTLAYTMTDVVDMRSVDNARATLGDMQELYLPPVLMYYNDYVSVSDNFNMMAGFEDLYGYCVVSNNRNIHFSHNGTKYDNLVGGMTYNEIISTLGENFWESAMGKKNSDGTIIFMAGGYIVKLKPKDITDSETPYDMAVIEYYLGWSA